MEKKTILGTTLSEELEAFDETMKDIDETIKGFNDHE